MAASSYKAESRQMDANQRAKHQPGSVVACWGWVEPSGGLAQLPTPPPTGPGAADRQAADRDVSRPPETDPVRGLHRGSVHARAPAGPGLHPEDRGIQPSDPVSAAPLGLLLGLLPPVGLQNCRLVPLRFSC
ncbi:unnamed protein product [Tetraodon nigroviridis]|uniref:(spotted green pufferfish) hypothetical protein n=1 Tax=Tetraodon nigroviridis TaxID=99883 RepID=Q4SKW2_TETNG|nr:unnamed protein product [Tetraodon nigroviridis]